MEFKTIDLGQKPGARENWAATAAACRFLCNGQVAASSSKAPAMRDRLLINEMCVMGRD